MDQVNESSPLDDSFVLGVYVREVQVQCDFVGIAHADLRRYLLALDPPGDRDEYRASMSRVFASLHALLAAAARVSKLLWGSKKAYAASRQPLRGALSVDDTSPLFERRLRNLLEHIDEYLDAWATSSKVFADFIVGPDNAIAGIDNAKSRFRQYDPAEETAYFLGEKFSLLPILAECERLAKVARRWEAQPHGR